MSIPNPLPPTIPGGVHYDTGVPGAFAETAGTLMLRADGAYHGPTIVTFIRNPRPSERDRIVRPERIDWDYLRRITED